MNGGIFRGFGAILYKEFIVVFRDRVTLFFMFFPPLVQIIAFGYALDTDVKHMAMVVLDEDRTVESRQLIDAFVNTGTFRVVGDVQDVAGLSAAIRRGQAYVGLQIPPQFTRDLRAGRKATVQVLIDGSSSTTALQALNTAIAVAFRKSVGTNTSNTAIYGGVLFNQLAGVLDTQNGVLVLASGGPAAAVTFPLVITVPVAAPDTYAHPVNDVAATVPV